MAHRRAGPTRPVSSPSEARPGTAHRWARWAARVRPVEWAVLGPARHGKAHRKSAEGRVAVGASAEWRMPESGWRHGGGGLASGQRTGGECALRSAGSGRVECAVDGRTAECPTNGRIGGVRRRAEQMGGRRSAQRTAESRRSLGGLGDWPLVECARPLGR
ncbi:hypothetical protein GUJ93_ZPchr0012g21237 [Zizania palustris]|uniref:Uncharacterized protein n=1 Tax=Zizania palustris TaxID=103762 RepID=A0A8J6BPT1_ZIZPA|nr:hypothetical protein GUJ93_ZPchr0012g21237 [Zizania palustris]